MSSGASELMLNLLKELALLKKLDEKHLESPESDLGNAEYDARQLRRREITDQIKSLGSTANEESHN
jgi:hypothetical protein